MLVLHQVTSIDLQHLNTFLSLPPQHYLIYAFPSSTSSTSNLSKTSSIFNREREHRMT